MSINLAEQSHSNILYTNSYYLKWFVLTLRPPQTFTPAGIQNKNRSYYKHSILHYMALQRHTGGAPNFNINLTLDCVEELQAVLKEETQEGGKLSQALTGMRYKENPCIILMCFYQ